MKCLWKTTFIAALLLAPRLFSQTWHWLEKPEVLNPSGIEVRDNVTPFQVLDWDEDGRWDLIQNSDGNFELFIQQPISNQFHKSNSVDFPQIGWTYLYPGYRLAKNFTYIDWDSDGYFDLAADSSLFWWNNGTNANPRWLKDDSILSGVPLGRDFSFADIDGDHDWEVILQDHFSQHSFVYRNTGDNLSPQWQLLDTLEAEGFGYKFSNLDGDSLIDLISIQYIPADPGSHLSLFFWQNHGSTSIPEWRVADWFSFFWSAFVGGQPYYSLFDFDSDNRFDLMKNDWMRHLAIHLNKSQDDMPAFQDTADFVYGAINGEANARPYFFDVDEDGLRDLILFEDFWTFFTFGTRFQEGRNTVYQNLNGRFEPASTIEKKIPQPFRHGYNPTFKKGITISFADVDRDEDTDFIASYISVDSQNAALSTGLLYFKNHGVNSEQQWQPDSTQFAYFLQPDSMFYDPHLVDFDDDDDFDLFLQKDEEYRFYERLNTMEENWQRNMTWEIGIENLNQYSATFSDLTRDGKPELIFGCSDGTLIMYENIGTENKFEWKLAEDAFSGVQVDSLAVPAFSDIDEDGQPDLFMGDADGRLFYYENTSIVDAVRESTGTTKAFQLAQNYPNPFNPSTTIRFSVPIASLVEIAIYNTLGQKIKVLAERSYLPGQYSVIWDGRNEANQLVASGVYICKLSANWGSFFRKLTFLK